jgi:hypothetical protein
MTNRPYFAAQPTQSRVVELIPGEHYIVFTDASDVLPDEDVIEELRILAYAQRNKGTLGPGSAQAIETLAGVVASGVITDAVWAECQEAKRFADKVRSRRRERIRKAAEAAKHALEAVETPRLPLAGLSAADVTVSGTGADGTTWQVSCTASGTPVELHMDVAGAVIDVIIRPRPQPPGT